MSPQFNHSLSTVFFIFFFCLIKISPPCMAARAMPREEREEYVYIKYKWQNVQSLVDARRGSQVSGIRELKSYLHHFGYLRYTNDTNEYDESFESAVAEFQSKRGLSVTGRLDLDTLSRMATPVCGVKDEEDVENDFKSKRRFVYFTGKPRWGGALPRTLTYAFSPDYMIRYVPLSDVKRAFERAFSRWASVIPVNFSETHDYGFADIRIGFYSGEHGDSEPFDGVLGVLAHSFSPESGKFHLDAAETWAVDFETERSATAFDLESVATHEIGHLLGLAHTPVKEAVMYPSLKPREKKLDLHTDDIQGVQALYGSNPNFTVASLSHESYISTSQAFPFLPSPSSFSLCLAFVLLPVLYA